MNDAPVPLNASHDYLGAGHDDAARRTTWVVALTAAMMVVEIAAGTITGSMALLADGFHMATHAGALGVAAFAYRYARRHADNPRYTFGTGKVGDLAGFASAITLALLAMGIAYESVSRLVSPVGIAFGDAALVATIGLAVNIVSAFLLGHGHSHGSDHDHAHDHDDHGHSHGHKRDNNLQAAYVHVLADALTSVLAIVALLAGRYFGWAWLDPAVGILGAVVILRWSVSLMRDTAAVLLDTADPALVARIGAAIEAPGDARVVDLHVWRVGPAAHAAIVEVQSATPCPAIRARLADIAAIAHLTIEMRAAG